jgi:UDP-N-acetylmuramoyl-tripeptide--D-alanyl-D-alanine ligase
MPELSIHQIAEIVQGNVFNCSSDIVFSDYHFDTRLIVDEPTLFFALKSENNDGHDYIPKLEGRKETTGAVVSKDFDATGTDIPVIQVEDPLKSAQQLAAWVRRTYNKIKYIGITGSAGKTTTKEFIYQVFSYQHKAYRSYKNWNNWIGMTFSILKMRGDERVAVFELAMSYPGIGEIDLLSSILKPDVAVVLNAYPTHLEFLKTVNNVAIGKSEILNYLDSDSTAFVNGDFDLLVQHTKSKKGRKIYYGKNSKFNDIVLKEIIREGDKSRIVIDFYGIPTEFITPFVNQVHIENLSVVILVAQSLGLKNQEIQEAITRIQPLQGRGNITRERDFTIIDETYNSNPGALTKTLEWVDQEYLGKKIAVIGDMLELGEKELGFHKEVGYFFSTLHFDQLITVGDRALKIAEGAEGKGFTQVSRFKKAKDAGLYLKENAENGSVILFKASRGIKLEEAIKEFKGE